MNPVKKSNISILLTLVFILASFSFGSAFAADWEKKAKSYFEDDYYDECIKVVRDLKDDNFARMFLAFSHLQLNKFNNTKSDQMAFKNAMIVLKDKTGSSDLDNLLYFVNQKDKPHVIKEARKLLGAAFKNCTQNEDVKKLVPLIRSSDEKTQDMTIKTVKKIIDPKRKMVNQGGTLREKDVAMMTDPDLIKALFESILTSPAASQTLLLIEKPVLKYISAYEGKKVMELESKITKEIAKREKKYPESNWYSATGKTR